MQPEASIGRYKKAKVTGIQAGGRLPNIPNVIRVVASYSHASILCHWKAPRKIFAYLNHTRELGVAFQEG